MLMERIETKKMLSFETDSLARLAAVCKRVNLAQNWLSCKWRLKYDISYFSTTPISHKRMNSFVPCNPFIDNQVQH